MIPMVPVFNGPGLLLTRLVWPRVFRRGPRGPFGNVGLTSETLVIGIGEGRGEGGPVSGESVTPESKTAPWMWGA